MSTTQTTNLGLTKATPGTGEPFSTSVVNTNLDTIDSAVGELQDSVSWTSSTITLTNGSFGSVNVSSVKETSMFYSIVGSLSVSQNRSAGFTAPLFYTSSTNGGIVVSNAFTGQVNSQGAAWVGVIMPLTANTSVDFTAFIIK